MRRCPRCELETDDWGKSRTVKGRQYPPPYCKPCTRSWNRDAYAAGRRYGTKRTTEEQTRVSWLRRLRVLGITEDQYLAALEAQEGKCAICRAETPWARSDTWHADHDHATGAFRGLLCSRCNRGLGYFRDDPELLQEAITYLSRTA